MANLGEFGAELAAVDDDADGPDTFLFHGHEFTLPQRVSSLPALRFAYNAQQVTAMEERATAAGQRARTPDQRAAAARLMAEVELVANAGLYAYLRNMLPGDQWETFGDVAAEAGATEQELLDVATKIMEAVAARPTRRSSGSPGGPSPTGLTSTDDSASTPSRGARVTVLPVLPEPPVETVSALEAARREIQDGSVSVADLVRSGG